MTGTYPPFPVWLSLPEFPRPPSLLQLRYDIFSWAVHIDRPYGAFQTISYRGLCSGGGGGNFASQAQSISSVSCPQPAAAWLSRSHLTQPGP